MITISPSPLEVYKLSEFDVTIVSDKPGQIMYCIGEGPLVKSYEIIGGNDYYYNSESHMPEVSITYKQKFGPWIEYTGPIRVKTMQSVKAALLCHP